MGAKNLIGDNASSRVYWTAVSNEQQLVEPFSCIDRGRSAGPFGTFACYADVCTVRIEVLPRRVLYRERKARTILRDKKWRLVYSFCGL